MALIDTHCHLYFDAFDADRDAVIARMGAAGVVGAVVIGIDPATIAQARQLAREHSFLHYAAGLHPTSAFEGEWFRDGSFDAGAYFAPWLDSDLQPVAIGECGIDLHWDTNTLEAMRGVFAAQLKLCRERDLPVVIHTRDANAQTLAVLEEHPVDRGVLHCFNGSPELLAYALARPGWYVSFAGNLTYPKAGDLQQFAREIPAERLLVETDAPFLAPQPVRGKRCEPAHVVHTSAYLAQLRGVPEGEMQDLLLANSEKCFGVNWA